MNDFIDAVGLCTDPMCGVAVEHPADHRGPFKTGPLVAASKARQEAERMSDDDEAALPCAEDVADKEPRWRAPTEQAVLVETEIDAASALKLAAIRLRDAEIERQAAGKAYAEALEAFNRAVAPVVK